MTEIAPNLFPFVFIGMWVFVATLLSMLSGWRSLAEYYAFEGEFNGTKRQFQSFSMGIIRGMPVNYSGVGILGANETGFYLSAWPMFRLGSPRLFIPYEALSGREAKVFLIFMQVNLTSERCPEVTIGFSRRQADWIEAQSVGAWRYERATSIN